jgi:hypothetical protein
MVCPVCKKQYVYNREGLIPPIDIVPVHERERGGDRLIIYDAQPAHDVTQRLTDGTKDWDVKKTVRYGVVMKPITGDGLLTLHVIPVEDDILAAYLRETAARASRGPGQSGPPATPVRRPNSGGLW